MCKRHSEGSGGSVPKKDSFRLPKDVVPKAYRVVLEPDLENFTFKGHGEIDVDVLSPVTKIVVNAKELEFHEATVTDAHGTTLVGTVDLDDENQLATINFMGTLAKGEWTIFTRWTGIHNDKLRGFYRSFWTDKEGKKQPIVCTQFESTDARRCMPCFDEPEFKATIQAELIIDEDLTAISNTKIVSEEPFDDGKRFIRAHDGKAKKRVVFAKTAIPLSTYLYAFVVGKFVSTEPVYVNGVELRVWTTPGKEHLTEFAVECMARATAYYEKRNDSKYPGDIINAVAIPDFSAGAMENWGCITYRETALLLNLATASQSEKKRVAEVIFHEHGHNDFGNKCTMRWWNGLWLNESFATHGENQAVSEEFPEWKVWEEFAISRGAAMRLDSLNSTHPIECPVNHPDEVAELFDLISYEKGCSVLYQIQQFIGDKVFRDGVAAYIKKHAFKNTETHDLWDALEESCKIHGVNVPVRKIMDAWVFTSGHPVVSVKEGKAKGFIELSQRPFKFLPKEDATLWPVPVTMQVKRADGTIETKKFVFEAATETHFVGDCEWVKVNAGGSGFYRVNYSPALLTKLTKNVQGTLSVVERYNLVNDTWAGVRAGLTSTVDYLDMVDQFVDETDPNVWMILAGSLRTLDGLLKDAARAELRKVVRLIARPAFDRLGMDPKADETVQDKELRGMLLGLLGTIGEDAECRKKAASLFESWKKDKTSIDGNLLPATVGVLAYNGDKARYDEFFNLYKTAATPQEEQRFLGALTAFRDKDLLNRSIELMMSEHVRTQDAPSIFGALLRNEVSGEAAWDYMRENWEKMVTAFPESGVVRMIGGAEALDTPELAAEVKDFFTKNQVKQGDMATAQMLEQLGINVRLRETESPKLVARFVPAPAPAKKEEAAPAKK